MTLSGGSCPPPRPVHAVATTARMPTAATETDRRKNLVAPLFMAVLQSRYQCSVAPLCENGAKLRPVALTVVECVYRTRQLVLAPAKPAACRHVRPILPSGASS